MRLISLSLQNYRRFSDAEIEFPDGVTGIIGLNGVGKSSLVEAIAWVLYGHDASRTKKEGIKRSHAAPEADCGATLRLEMNGDCYEVSRRLRGASLSTDARVLVNGTELVRSPERTTKEVERFLGMDRRSFFRSFYARQKDLNVLSGVTPRDRKDVIIKMLRIDAIDRAIERVRGDRREKVLVMDTLRSQLTDKKELTGEIRETEERLKGVREARENRVDVVRNLNASFRQVKEELARLDRVKDTVSGAMSKRSVLEAELKHVTAVIDDLDVQIAGLADDEMMVLELSPIVDDLDRLRQEEEKLAELSKMYLRRQSLVSEYEKSRKRSAKLKSRIEAHPEGGEELDGVVKSLEDAEEKLERIRSGIEQLSSRRSALRAELGMLKKNVDELDERSERISELGRDACCPTCGRQLGEDYERITEHFQAERKELVSGIVAKESAIAELEARVLKGREMRAAADEDVKTLRQKRIECEKRREERAQLLVLKGEMEREIVEISGVLEKLAAVEYDEEEHRSLRREIAKKSGVREELAGYRTKLNSRRELERKLADSEGKRVTLAKELDGLNMKLSSIDYSETRHAEIKADWERTAEKLQEEQASLHSAEMDLKSATDRLEWLRSNLEEISRREKEFERLRGETAKLGRLADLFVDFRLRLIQKARPRLSALASTLFERMTEGKYQGIELSEDYEMFLVEAGELHSIDRFSGGEIDLANLSLRLAISELILEATGNQLSFIILDEIFGSQDMIRKGLIMDALKEISRRFRQILLITHVEEIKDSLENVIEIWENEEGVSVIKQE